jgi:hypothetical protein
MFERLFRMSDLVYFWNSLGEKNVILNHFFLQSFQRQRRQQTHKFKVAFFYSLFELIFQSKVLTSKRRNVYTLKRRNIEKSIKTANSNLTERLI